MISSQTSGDISFLTTTCLLTLTEKMGDEHFTKMHCGQNAKAKERKLFIYVHGGFSWPEMHFGKM